MRDQLFHKFSELDAQGLGDETLRAHVRTSAVLLKEATTLCDDAIGVLSVSPSDPDWEARMWSQETETLINKTIDKMEELHKHMLAGGALLFRPSLPATVQSESGVAF